MIKVTEKFFKDVYTLSRLKEENTMNYFKLVLRKIRSSHNVTYDFDKIYEINNEIIDANNKAEEMKRFKNDYFEGYTLEHFIKVSKESSVLALERERPEGRSNGISTEEQHLLIDFLGVLQVLVQERKMNKDEDKKIDFQGTTLSAEELSNAKEKIKKRIDSAPNVI